MDEELKILWKEENTVVIVTYPSSCTQEELHNIEMELSTKPKYFVLQKGFTIRFEQIRDFKADLENFLTFNCEFNRNIPKNGVDCNDAHRGGACNSCAIRNWAEERLKELNK